MAFPTERVNNMADQLEALTDCESLIIVLDEFIDEMTGMMQDFIKEQIEILKEELPLLDIPTSINKIIDWIKKFVIGRILPRLRAFIKLIKKIAEFAESLQRLFNVIQSIPEKIERCLTEITKDLVNTVQSKIRNAIDSITAPIDSALAEIKSLQDQIENIIENPLDFRIVTDSLDGFLESIDIAEEAINKQLEDYVNEPLPPEPEANTA